jgi:hypothetical protein
MFQRLQDKLRQWVLGTPPPPMPQTAMESRLQMLLESRPALLAWRIDNGFLLVQRDIHRDELRLHYCADHQAIADYLITSAAQQTMFPHSANTLSVKNLAASSMAAPSYRPGVI